MLWTGEKNSNSFTDNIDMKKKDIHLCNFMQYLIYFDIWKTKRYCLLLEYL